MRSTAFPLAFIALGCLLVTEVVAAPASTSFSAWYRALGEVIEDAPGMQAAFRNARAADHGIEAAIRQAPFSIDSSLEYTHFVSGLGANFVPGSPIVVPSASAFDLRSNSRLGFGLRERFFAQLDGSVGLLEAMGTGTFAAENLPFSLGLRLQYDVLRGGNRSAENDRARADAVSALGSKLQSWDQMLALRLELQSVTSALYGNACKQRGLEALRERAERALSEAEVQKSAKVLSQTDFLNFRFLRSSVMARVARLTAERAELEARLMVFGELVARKVAASIAAVRTCDPDFSALRSLSPPEAPVLERTAETAPGVAAQRAVQLALVFAREARGTELLPGLSPFLAGRIARPDGLDSEVASVSGGLALDWAIPGERGAQGLEAATVQHRAAEAAAEAARLGALSELKALAARMTTQQQLMRVLEATAEDSAALVEILDVRRSIGDVDALNLASAVSGNLDAQFSLVDAAIQIEGAFLQIETYREASRASVAELERLSSEHWTE